MEHDDYCDDCGWDDVAMYGKRQLCGVCAEEQGLLEEDAPEQLAA